jgi:NAD(P)-dependent dehydrogenase (short-subunit alcohol dehydrogenase family)
MWPEVSGIAVWSPALLHGINNAALLHMTGFLAADLAVNKVTVNAVVPGLVGTEFRQTWTKELGERQGKSTEEFVGELQEQGYLARTVGGSLGDRRSRRLPRVGSSELHHRCEDTNRRWV